MILVQPKYRAMVILLLLVLDTASLVNTIGPIAILRRDEDISKVVPEHVEKKAIKNYQLNEPGATGKVNKVNFDDPACDVDVRLRWAASVGSSVYAPPVIFPSGLNGAKQIFTNTFHQFMELVGFDGYKPWGWPLTFEGSSFMGSPILHDIDKDGLNDIGSIDKEGNLFWVRVGDYGQYLDDFHVKVPKLKVKRDWADHLDPKWADQQVMLSMFDHEDPQDWEVNRANVAKKDDLGLGGPANVLQASYPELKRRKSEKGAFDSDGLNLKQRRLVSEPSAQRQISKDNSEDVSENEPGSVEHKEATESYYSGDDDNESGSHDDYVDKR